MEVHIIKFKCKVKTSFGMGSFELKQEPASMSTSRGKKPQSIKKLRVPMQIRYIRDDNLMTEQLLRIRHFCELVYPKLGSQNK